MSHIRQPRRKKNSLVDWMMMKENDVFERYMSLPNARRVGEGNKQYVYIPGTRDDRALLVAHADTVWGDKTDIEVLYSDGMYYSKYKNVGIGADDRAGVGLVYLLRNLGHSILIPNGEEKGCVGSEFIREDKELIKEINDHQFVIECDRRHNSDLVFYRVGSPKFKEWCEENFKGYEKAWGSRTDICVLCRTVAGVNISIGYYKEHTGEEHLVEKEWHRTHSRLREVLSKTNLPKFIQEPETWERPSVPMPQYAQSPIGSCIVPRRKSYDTHNFSDDYFKQQSSFLSTMVGKKEEKIKLLTSLLVCPYCDFFQDRGEWETNGRRCTHDLCKKAF